MFEYTLTIVPFGCDNARYAPLSRWRLKFVCNAAGFVLRSLAEAQTSRRACEGMTTFGGNTHFAGTPALSVRRHPARSRAEAVVFQISIQSLDSPSSSVMPS